MACTKQQLQDFIDDISEEATIWMDQDGITLRATYTDSNNITHQKCFEIGESK